MSDSPLAEGPYEILGVTASASDEELRRAYRRRLREAHPDAGGSAEAFHAVQRAWELVGTEDARAAFDRGRSSVAATEGFAPRRASTRPDTRPQARMHGHPGGWFRELFLGRLHEWAGRGRALDDPYDPALLRSAPRGIRRLLARAIAEEETARRLAPLGIGFTVWHDVNSDPRGYPPQTVGVGLPNGPPLSAVEKIDHVVLGPTGLWALLSEDWGSEVGVARGELIGRGLDAGERPVRALADRARRFTRRTRTKVSALVVVVPDGAAESDVEAIGTTRGIPAFLVQRSVLASVLRNGIEGVRTGGTDLFEVRARISSAVRHV